MLHPYPFRTDNSFFFEHWLNVVSPQANRPHKVHSGCRIDGLLSGLQSLSNRVGAFLQLFLLYLLLKGLLTLFELETKSLCNSTYSTEMNEASAWDMCWTCK